MTIGDLIVIAAGAALIAGELWYFLGPRRSAPAVPQRDGVQEVRVLVRGGYDPDTILVEVGRPVRLQFYRDETAECSGQVLFDSLGIEQALPPFQTTSVQFTPATAGEYPFRCGKSVMRGRVVAQEGRDEARAHLGRGHRKHG